MKKQVATNIYLIARLDHVDYDEYDSFVIIAESEQRVREIALDAASGANELSWISPINSKVEKIGTSDGTEEEVILGSFNAD